jgi:hypothetical protein
MAALAERLDIAVLVAAMRRIMVEMGGCQDDLGRPYGRILGQGRRGGPAASSVAPSLLLLIPPATIAQVLDNRTMRPAADLNRE